MKKGWWAPFTDAKSNVKNVSRLFNENKAL